MLFIAALIAAAYFMIKFFLPSTGKAPLREAVQQSPYYKNGKFVNLVPTKSAEFSQIPRIIRNYWKRNVENEPTKNYRFNADATPPQGNMLQINWLGHAAVLLHKNGKYILTDPMLSERASPLSFMGPKRFSPSPIAAENLPELEAVIISHDHYDHLDYATIKTIASRTKCFYVPTGVAASLLYWGVPSEKIREMSWWESTSLDSSISITATPARHFSGRLFSQNNTFWASWVIDWDGEKIYFGGDTGIFDGFEQIDERLGPFELALLPIGAYNDAWHDIHMDAKEAVEAFLQMRVAKMFPIHWGTFDLALHAWYEPIHELEQIAESDSIPLLSLPQGKWFTTGTSTEKGWWKQYSEMF